MLKGEFRTAYLQREIPLDVAVVTATNLVVGELVKLTPANGDVPAYIESAANLADATHMIAQSDMTMEYGHVPVEYQDWRYSDKVAGTATSVAGVTATTPFKKVAMFELYDKNDIVAKEV